VALLAALPPSCAGRCGPHQYALVVLDGTLIPVDRLAADRPFHSGKHRRQGMNLQVIISLDGDILWVSGVVLRGAVHDLTAARTWGVWRDLATAGSITLADKVCTGAGDPVLTPYRGRSKPASRKDANRAYARLRSGTNRPVPAAPRAPLRLGLPLPATCSSPPLKRRARQYRALSANCRLRASPSRSDLMSPHTDRPLWATSPRRSAGFAGAQTRLRATATLPRGGELISALGPGGIETVESECWSRRVAVGQPQASHLGPVQVRG
jgi:hypothetical protein